MTAIIKNVASLSDIVRRIQPRGRRLMIAIAGPPGSGKSTLSVELVARLNDGGDRAAVITMDGFHFDNAILNERNLLARKGSPATFDTAGFAALMGRLQSEDEIAIPVFDRALDLTRGWAAVIKPHHHVLIIEGNYLLLDAEPWGALRANYDLAISIAIPRRMIQERLLKRWIDHGLSHEAAFERVRANDLVNADLVMQASVHPDFIYSTW